MGIEVRTITDGEVAAWIAAVNTGFLNPVGDVDAETFRPDMCLDRTWAGFDGDTVVSTLRSFPSQLTVPGGGALEASAVTGVTTTSTHRRRGLASRLITAELAASVERGEQLSILIAAEWRIYGRFGYGAATEHQDWTVDSTTAQLRQHPQGTVEYVDRSTARALVPEVYERHRSTRPGEISRSAYRWDLEFRIVRPPSWTEPKPSFYVVARDPAGSLSGVAEYRIEARWEQHRPKGEVTVRQFVTGDPMAESLLWYHLINVDLMASVSAANRPVDELLPLLLADARHAYPSDRGDFMWIRSPVFRTLRDMSETQPTRRPRRSGAGQSVGGSRQDWAGQPAAIYCRMSHVRDEDQTGVDRQERICRKVAERLGVVIVEDAVFVDNNRSAWQRRRHRPGWESLLEAIRAGRVAHVIVYHPDRLMRQPRDLEELLSICDDRQVTLHGEANQRDLSNPDDRFFLRIEVAHACRSSDDTSRRLRSAHADRARDGVPHSGPRPFGYTADRMHLVEDEAEIVRELFRRVVQGESVTGLARELNQRGIRTAMGNTWTPVRVRGLVRSPRVAGIQIYRGELMGAGTWPAIVPQGLWEEVQERLKFRATQLPPRTGAYYLLRGVVFCTRCGARMVGVSQSGRRSYVCSRQSRVDKMRCLRRIHAAALESFVTEAAIRLLETLDVSGAPTMATLSSPADDEAVSKDLEELAELREMWDARELNTKEYREMRRSVEVRIKKARARTVVRPAVEVLEGMVGPNAAQAWQARYDAGDFDRLNAILRFLFAAVRIGESTAARFRLDFDRVSIERNELHA